MASRKFAGELYTSPPQELEDELYSNDDDDDDWDLFDADELGLDPEEDDEYYASIQLFYRNDGQSIGFEPTGWLAV